MPTWWLPMQRKWTGWRAMHTSDFIQKNATMFRNMQSRLSPDEWLHGYDTGGRVAHGCAIPLREYSSARSCNDTPKRQLTIHDFCKATAVAVDSKATAVAACSKADDTPKRQLTIHHFFKVSPQLPESKTFNYLMTSPYMFQITCV